MRTRIELVFAICLDWPGSTESMTEIEGLFFAYLLFLEKIVYTTNSLPRAIYCSWILKLDSQLFQEVTIAASYHSYHWSPPSKWYIIFC